MSHEEDDIEDEDDPSCDYEEAAYDTDGEPMKIGEIWCHFWAIRKESLEDLLTYLEVCDRGLFKGELRAVHDKIRQFTTAGNELQSAMDKFFSTVLETSKDVDEDTGTKVTDDEFWLASSKRDTNNN
jgi:hypothetical protein